jgi:large subunit ribosomal protein L15
MLSHEITSIAGGHKDSKKIGRGGKRGKTCGRGHKGSGSRAGSFARPTYEGGQMPLFRRLPKRGFNNARFARRYEVVNVSQLDRFEDGDIVGVKQLASVGLVGGLHSRVKILGEGQLTKKLQVTAHKFSKTAEQKITACGGKAQMLAYKENGGS